jgi:hypothetical protein
VVATKWISSVLVVGLVEAGSWLYVLSSRAPPTGVTQGSPAWVSNWWFPYVLAGLGLLTAAAAFFLFSARQPPDSESEEEASAGTVADRYCADSAGLLGRLLGNPLYILTLVNLILLDIGLAGLWSTMKAVLRIRMASKPRSF